MPPPRHPSLASQTLLWGRGWRYYADTPGMPLSLKCLANGRARYTVAGRDVAVDDDGWLIVNDGQPYTMEIESPTLVNTFIVWFPTGWAEEVQRSLTTPAADLLAEPARPTGPCRFFEHYTRNETVLAPAAHALRRAFYAGAEFADTWLEQYLRGLLARMLDVQQACSRAAARLPAVRLATREELWHRLNRARDYIHARCGEPLTLREIAAAAALSPYHFLRAFKQAFGATPHEWLTACRIERAKFLLARTPLPVTEICAAIGHESLGSFSAAFKRHTGASPRRWRQLHGARTAIRNIREEFSPPAPVASRG